VVRAAERKVRAVLVAPEPWAGRLDELVRRERLPLVVRREGKGDLRVAAGGASGTSTRSTLRPGGRISCPAARAMAERAGIPHRKMARLLDVLEIRVEDCDLGCF
jgi:hypothetical protein